MQKVYRDFILACKVNEDIANPEIGDVSRTNHANYGLVAQFKGHTTNVFNQDLSGVEIQNLNLELYKTYEQDC